jgi:hypothetical protein
MSKKNKHNLKISLQYCDSQVNKKMKFQEYNLRMPINDDGKQGEDQP